MQFIAAHGGVWHAATFFLFPAVATISLQFQDLPYLFIFFCLFDKQDLLTRPHEYVTYLDPSLYLKKKIYQQSNNNFLQTVHATVHNIYNNTSSIRSGDLSKGTSPTLDVSQIFIVYKKILKWILFIIIFDGHFFDRVPEVCFGEVYYIYLALPYANSII